MFLPTSFVKNNTQYLQGEHVLTGLDRKEDVVIAQTLIKKINDIFPIYCIIHCHAKSLN